MIEQRMIDFEIKISHQENAIEALQKLVYEQQKTIDNLLISVKTLAKRVEAGARGQMEIGPANEKPPHY